MVRVPALAIVALALAGCLAPSTPGAPSADAGVRLAEASGLPTDPRTGATLAEAPAWRLGEWWRIAFSAPPYGVEAELTVVVAGVSGDAYLVGQAGEALDDGVVILHFPPLGEIAREDLSFEAHDRRLEFLRFPLVDGATWETQWYTGAPLTANVVRVEGDVADVTLSGAREIALAYDAAAGWITRFAIDGYGGYEVLEHGYGHEGPVRVPVGQDLVFCHGRQGGVQQVTLCETGPATSPGAPTSTVELPDAYDRVTFGLFLRDARAAPVGSGAYRIDVTAPDGSTYSAAKTPERPGMEIHAYSMDDPGGAWEITAVTAGDGLAILEGVAYDVADVSLR